MPASGRDHREQLVRGARLPTRPQALPRGVRVVVVLLLAASAVVAPGAAGRASAQAAGPACDASLLGADALARCLLSSGGGAGPGSGSSGGGGGSGPQYRYRYVLTCAANTVGAPTEALCDQATATCTAPELLYRQYRSTDGVAWELLGTRCMTPAEATAGEAFPGFTLADFQRLPLPPGDVAIEPGNGYALVQVPLNVMAGAAVTVLPTQLLGFGVSVRATPVSYTWDFGDGTTLGPTAEAGTPYPALGLTHTYTAGGGYAITLTTTYAGEFSVEGGAFEPIGGTAAVVSAPVPVIALTGHGALVQDPLR